MPWCNNGLKPALCRLQQPEGTIRYHQVPKPQIVHGASAKGLRSTRFLFFFSPGADDDEAAEPVAGADGSMAQNMQRKSANVGELGLKSFNSHNQGTYCNYHLFWKARVGRWVIRWVGSLGQQLSRRFLASEWLGVCGFIFGSFGDLGRRAVICLDAATLSSCLFGRKLLKCVWPPISSTILKSSSGHQSSTSHHLSMLCFMGHVM